MFNPADDDGSVLTDSCKRKIIRFRAAAGENQPRPARLVESCTDTGADDVHCLVDAVAGSTSAGMLAGRIGGSRLVRLQDGLRDSGIECRGGAVVQINCRHAKELTVRG